jgi:hypothetical protein
MLIPFSLKLSIFGLDLEDTLVDLKSMICLQTPDFIISAFDPSGIIGGFVIPPFALSLEIEEGILRWDHSGAAKHRAYC